MADVKWIKITTDIFDDEKILLIESLPDAYAIITVWFKLLCLAGKQNNSGVFMMGKIAYTDKMLATIFRMKEATVTMALNTFEQFGMVEIVDGVITIPNWGKHQSLDQLESKKEYMRSYMTQYRAKQKALTSGEKPRKTNSKTNSKTNVSLADKDIDKDTDKDIDKEEDKDKTTTTTNYHSFLQSEEYAIFKKVSEAFGACGAKSNPEDFIAYNESRGWAGIGGESVLDNLERYVTRWENGEQNRSQKETVKRTGKRKEAEMHQSDKNAKTAGTDAAIMARAEALKKQFT